MSNIILGLIANAILKRVPRSLLKRIYPIEKLQDDVEMDIQSTGERVTFYLSQPSPHLNVCLRVTNKSPYVDIVLDRVLLTVSANGERICAGSLLERKAIAQRQSDKNICIRIDLNQFQEKVVKKGSNRMSVHVLAYFESEIGVVERRVMLDGVRAEVCGVQGEILRT